MICYRIGDLNDLNAVYDSFALEFPENERKSLDQLSVLMEKKEYKLIIAEDLFMNQHKRVGFSFVYTPDGSDFIWLDYLVIEKEFQGKGYGSLFFNYIIQFHKQAKGMYIEIEIPTGTDINQVRRIAYYERLGAKKVPVAYQFPTQDGSVPMYFYFSKRDESYEVSMTDVFQAIEKAHAYIHWDHYDKESILKNIKSGSDQ